MITKLLGYIYFCSLNWLDTCSVSSDQDENIFLFFQLAEMLKEYIPTSCKELCCKDSPSTIVNIHQCGGGHLKNTKFGCKVIGHTFITHIGKCLFKFSFSFC